MPENMVALMARWPQVGQVKTRLAQAAGEDSALQVYRRLLSNVLANCKPVNTSEYTFGCFVTPAERCAAFQREYPQGSFYEPQQGYDLGERMQRAFDKLFAEYKTRKAILIGADIPMLSREHILTALDSLDSADICWGPTEDGGYYLIGMKERVAPVFDRIDWGTSNVLARSVLAAKQAGYSYRLLEPLADLDTTTDLDRFPGFLP